MKRFLLSLLFVLVMTVSVNAQQWQTANSINVAWDAVTVTSGTVTYKLYSKTVPGGVETFISTVSTTGATVTFQAEGRYFLGVRSVRTVNGVELEASTISWSDNPAVCQGGVTFGVQYYTLPAPVGGIRIGGQ